MTSNVNSEYGKGSDYFRKRKVIEFWIHALGRFYLSLRKLNRSRSLYSSPQSAIHAPAFRDPGEAPGDSNPWNPLTVSVLTVAYLLTKLTFSSSRKPVSQSLVYRKYTWQTVLSGNVLTGSRNGTKSVLRSPEKRPRFSMIKHADLSLIRPTFNITKNAL